MNDFDLGNARGYVEIDPSGVKRGMEQAKEHFDLGLSSMLGGLQQLGGSLQTIGSQMTVLGAPFAAGMGLAIKSAVDFDESMTNVGAVLGKSREEMAGLTAEILEIGAASRDGPQAATEAFYDIVGGVADATTHMAILNSAIATAEAGNAGLGGVTSALISIMNSYGYEAEQAAFASDVLTRTVGVGVGTMDQLAAALPTVAGLANSVGVSFDDLGAMMGQLSTKGNTFAASATQIRAIMVAMLNPNERMKKALAEVGVESGKAAIEQYGLAGALELLNKESPTFIENMAGTLGSVEALNGAISLTSDGASEFLEDFSDGLEGATDAARELQLASPAAAFDLLMSKIDARRIKLGDALIPVLLDVADAIMPLVDSLIEWIEANPDLVATVGALIGGLVTLGPVIAGIGLAISTLASPVGLAIAAVGALGAAWTTNFLGIRDIVTPVIESVTRLLTFFAANVRDFGLKEAFLGIFGQGTIADTMESSLEGSLVMLGLSREAAVSVVDGIWSQIERLANGFQWLKDTLSPLFTEISKLFSKIDFGKAFQLFRDIMAFTSPMGAAIKTLSLFGVDFKAIFEEIVGGLTRFLEVINSGGGFFDGLRAAFGNTAFLDAFEQGFNDLVGFVTNTVIPGLQQLYTWFVEDALPAIVSFIETTVFPAIEGFFSFLAGVWESVAPTLEMLYNWFVNDALPAITSLLVDSVIPAVQSFISWLGDIWAIVGPALGDLYKWFVETALPAVLNFISGTVIPGIQGLIDILKKVWDDVSPFLTKLFDWFVNVALPEIIRFVEQVAMPVIDSFIGLIKGIWDAISPALKDVYNWFITNGLPFIEDAIEAVTKIVSGLIDILKTIWDTVKPYVDAFSKGLSDIFGWIKTNVIDPVLNALKSVIDWARQALVDLGLVQGEASKTTDAVGIAQQSVGSGGISYMGVNAGKGFAAGGFTGSGPAGAIAGYVHANEYVIPAQGVPVLRENDPARMLFQPGSVVINANSYEQGRAAADGFDRRLEELMRSRG